MTAIDYVVLFLACTLGNLFCDIVVCKVYKTPKQIRELEKRVTELEKAAVFQAVRNDPWILREEPLEPVQGKKDPIPRCPKCRAVVAKFFVHCPECGILLDEAQERNGDNG